MTVAEHEKTRRGAFGWLLAHPGVAELGIVAGCLLIYFLVRGEVVDKSEQAFKHAADVIGLEQRLGFFWEPAWQRAVHGNAFQTRLWNYVYFWLHAPAIVAVAFWLYFRSHRIYLLFRNAFLVSALIGLFVYAVYPVAPPRLITAAGYGEFGVKTVTVPGYGFEDTMREYSQVSYQAESLKPFVNPFAAIPSLHFGWAFLIGLAVALTLRNRWGVLCAILLPLLMLFGVVMTANHFLFDAIVGLAVCLLGLAAATGFSHATTAFQRRRSSPFQQPVGSAWR